MHQSRTSWGKTRISEVAIFRQMGSNKSPKYRRIPLKFCTFPLWAVAKFGLGFPFFLGYFWVWLHHRIEKKKTKKKEPSAQVI
jgi:hypothetical protein